MPVKLPPPAAKTGKGEKGVFTAFVNAHSALKPYASDIWTQANNYGGITPTQLAAVIWAESKGNPAAVSGAGAKGVAQIYDTNADPRNAAGVPFFRADTRITDADKANAKFSIQYAAWRLSGYAATHGGSIDQIWIGGYNPNFKAGVDGPANYISQFLPKGYVGTASPTATDTATKSVDTSAATAATKASLFDKWAVLGADGKVKFTKITDPSKPPANVLKYGPTPLTQTSFIQTWKQTYQDQFFAFTGRQASGKRSQHPEERPSIYTLQNTLAATKTLRTARPTRRTPPGWSRS
jgi:hypothetical protein